MRTDAARPQRGVDHRPLSAERRGADEVERRALERRADDVALGQRRAQVLRREALHARPQRGEGRPRLLRLQAADAVDRLGDAEAAPALEQQLSRERRPPERAPRHDLRAHAPRSSSAASAPARTASGAPPASITRIRSGSAAARAS